jgi:hypothetical protein
VQEKFNQGTEAGNIKIPWFIFVLPILSAKCGLGVYYENRYYKRIAGIIAKPDAA